ncbi:MAG: hypothetical protein K0R77_2100 [Chryseobacterium sp.]|jgi:tetratricopeptide (TPR) repeat protein|uniref:tetratricopeptide repeat protein n=1 Tax=Chryseobacterium sp. TaxID=1871047 RepID=UPI0026360225|nr:tetratricopeptide repeat protein [Chryseobacterium sp.]MDF2552825.1 hypothetical protein [Chryseobacterium sp.]
MILKFNKLKLTLLVSFCSLFFFAQNSVTKKEESYAETSTSQNKKLQDLGYAELVMLVQNDPKTFIKNEKEIYNSKKKTDDKIDVLLLASEAYSAKEDYKNMLRRLFQAKEIVDSAGSEQKKIGVRLVIAKQYQILGLNDRAKKEILESLHHLNTTPENKNTARLKVSSFHTLAAIDMADSTTVNNQTITYLDSASFYINRAPHFAQIEREKVSLFFDKGAALMLLKKYDEAKINFSQAKKIIVQYPETSFILPYINLGFGAIAYEEKDYNTAIQYFNQAIDQTSDDERVGTDIKESAYEYLTKTYKALGDTKNYMLYNEKWQKIAKKKSTQIRNGVLQALDEVEKEQKQTLYRKYSTTINYFIVIALVIIFGLVFL